MLRNTKTIYIDKEYRHYISDSLASRSIKSTQDNLENVDEIFGINYVRAKATPMLYEIHNKAYEKGALLKLAINPKYGQCPVCGSFHTKITDREPEPPKVYYGPSFIEHFYCKDCKSTFKLEIAIKSVKADDIYGPTGQPYTTDKKFLAQNNKIINEDAKSGIKDIWDFDSHM